MDDIDIISFHIWCKLWQNSMYTSTNTYCIIVWDAYFPLEFCQWYIFGLWYCYYICFYYFDQVGQIFHIPLVVILVDYMNLCYIEGVWSQVVLLLSICFCPFFGIQYYYSIITVIWYIEVIFKCSLHMCDNL